MAHDHGHTALGGDRGGPGQDRPLVIAIVINVLLTVVELVGGVLGGSLALVADALHNLGDAGALVVALVARRVARRSADEERTFGYRRAETVGAVINLTALLLVGVYLLGEAAARAFRPEPVDGALVMVLAGVALVIDVWTVVLTRRTVHGGMNVRAAMLHNLSDAAASVAVLVAGLLVWLYGWNWTDLAASVLLAVWILVHGQYELRKAIRLLMQSVPPGMSVRAIAEAVRGVEGVADVHHLHVWQMDEQSNSAEMHVVTERERAAELAECRQRVKAVLAERFGIEHSTLEFEFCDEELGEGCGGLVTPH